MTNRPDSGQTWDRILPAPPPNASSLSSNAMDPTPAALDAIVPRPGPDVQAHELGPFVHSYIREYIQLADQKAAFVFAAAAALIVFAERTGAVTAMVGLGVEPTAREIAALLALLLLSLASLFAVAVIRPRLKGALQQGVIYWDEIRTTALPDYLRRASSLSSAAVHREILSHAYVLAGVAQRKYGLLTKSISTGIAGFVSLLGYMLL